eukprot:4580097-Prymnesium_polylepis.1
MSLAGSVWPERQGERVLAVLRVRCEGGAGEVHLRDRAHGRFCCSLGCFCFHAPPSAVGITESASASASPAAAT